MSLSYRQDKKSLRFLLCRGKETNTIKLSADNRLAFLYNVDRLREGSRQVAVYDIQQQKQLASIEAPEGENINQVTLSADGRLAFLYNVGIFGEGSRQVAVYDVQRQKQLASIEAPKEEVINQDTLSADSRMAFLYEDAEEEFISRLAIIHNDSKEAEAITKVTHSRDSHLAFLYDDKKGSRQVLVYDVQQRKQLTPIAASEGEIIDQVTLSADSRLAFLYNSNEATRNRQVLVYDVQQQKQLTPIAASEGEIIDQVTLSPDSRLVFLYNSSRYRGSRSSRQVVLVYDVQQQKQLVPIVVPEAEDINTVTLSADSRLAFLYNSNEYTRSRQVLVYDVQKQKQLVPIVVPEREDIDTVTLSADISLAILYGDSKEAITKVTLSRDSHLAFLYDDKKGSRQVLVYDVQQQKQLTPIATSEGEIIDQVTLSPDSRLVFLYNSRYRGSHQVVLVYDVQQQRPLAPLRFEQAILGMNGSENVNDVSVFSSHFHVYVYQHRTHVLFLLCQVSEQITEVVIINRQCMVVKCSHRIYLQKNWLDPIPKLATTLKINEGHLAAVNRLIKFNETSYFSSNAQELIIWQLQRTKAILLQELRAILMLAK